MAAPKGDVSTISTSASTGYSRDNSNFEWRHLMDPQELVLFSHRLLVVLDKFTSSHVRPVLISMWKWPLIIHVFFVLTLAWTFGRTGMNPVISISCAAFLMWKALEASSVALVQKVRVDTYREYFLGAAMSPDNESAHWMNVVLEKVWPVFLERLISEKLTPKLAPWFLNTYKPAVLSKIQLHSVRMGSSPPLVTAIRAYKTASEGNDVELESYLELVCGPDMFMKLSANVRVPNWAGLGLIPWVAYATDLKLRGKCRIGLRFAASFPFVDRLSISFVEEPSLSLTVKVMGLGLAQGFDSSVLPMVADYLKSTLSNALTTSIVTPNRLDLEDIVTFMKDVIDMAEPPPAEDHAGLVKPPTEVKNGGKGAVAWVHLEVLRGQDLMAADLNGSSDPYVKGNLGGAKFRSSVKKRCVNPVWNEEFEVPVREWAERTVLRLQVLDRDNFKADDDLGMCEVDVGALRGGLRHELVEELKGASSGKLILAVTVVEGASFEKKEPSTEGVAVASIEADLDAHRAADDRKDVLTKRAVHLGDGARKEIVPGCVVHTWDF